MSGGSFNYFYRRAPEDIREMANTLIAMADRCDKSADRPPEKHWQTGEMIDLAALAEVGAYLRLMGFRMRGVAKMLEVWEDVTHDVEWWQSGDSGPADVVESFRKIVPAHTTGEGQKP